MHEYKHYPYFEIKCKFKTKINNENVKPKIV